jgi:nucleoside 2-deoxyribosyltransferase
VYIAGPYTAPDARRIEQNIRRAEDVAYQLLDLRVMPLCPHTNTRWMVADPTLAAWMYPATLELMRRCDAVLFIEGWQRSSGAQGERTEAMRLNMPVFFSIDELRAWVEGRGK